MTRLTWNDVGERYFETGLDCGVFYTDEGNGIVWNGLISVKESLSGGSATPYYIDGVKYLNIAGAEEFGGSIEAYMYPEEFGEYDGTEQMFVGFVVNLQRRRPFSLSYRTRIGNDVDGENHGYKLHIIYDILAEPSEKTYSTLTDSPEANNFSWTFTTTPVSLAGTNKYTAHVTIDSTKVSVGLMRSIENHLYGAQHRSASLMPIDKLIDWFTNGGEPLEIDADDSGLGDLHESVLIEGRARDLISTENAGLYIRLPNSRLEAMTNPDVGRIYLLNEEP